MLQDAQKTIEALFKEFTFLKSIRFSKRGGMTIVFKAGDIKYCEFFETLLEVQEYLEKTKSEI